MHLLVICAELKTNRRTDCVVKGKKLRPEMGQKQLPDLVVLLVQPRALYLNCSSLKWDVNSLTQCLWDCGHIFFAL